MTIERRRITDRDEWLRWRRGDITASDIGAIAGVDPYRSRLAVHAQKTGLAGAPDETAIMRRGRWLEPAVLKALAETFRGWIVKPAEIYLRDPQIRLGCTPDAFAIDPERDAGEETIVQAKVVAKPTFEREWETLRTVSSERPYIVARAPLRYELQALCEAMLYDAPQAIVAALVIDTYGAELAVAEVPRHDAAERRLRGLATDFWEQIASGQLPPADFSRDAELIRTLYRKGGDGVLDLSGNNRIGELCEEHLRWQGRKKAAEGALDFVDAEICDVLRDHEVGEHPHYGISWKSQHRKEVTIPATSFRVLRITRRGKKAEKDEGEDK